MGITRVVQLDIEKFRRLNGITVPIGNKVTLVAGQNGTSKSTLLGMLAQPFSFGVLRGKTAKTEDKSSYTDNYHELKLHEYMDHTGKPFMYDCDDVFRLSKFFDSGKAYIYSTVLDGANILSGSGLHDNPLKTKSRTKGRTRFVTGPGASHKSGEGNFPHPVIYLGLNRLWPLAVTRRCSFSGDSLSNDDKKWFVEKYNKILCLDEHDNKAKFMDTVEKRKFITPENETYDGESCSAGQDNLSQLLTAVLSFRSLKEKLGKQYSGGMLLIDELDATFHAFAQDELLELLCEVSNELDLQIIATTHSLRLLEKAYQSSLKKDVKVLYLANVDSKIAIQNFSTYQDIANHLMVQAPTPSMKKPQKVSVVFEDKEAELFYKQICGKSLSMYVSCNNTDTLCAGNLKNLAEMSKSLPVLQDLIFIADGDMFKTWTYKPKNLLVLPGDHRPETLVYRHLFALKDADQFWSNSYTRQVAITAKGGCDLATGDCKKWVKKWYSQHGSHWGRGKKTVFESWINIHKDDCLAFTNKFIKLLKQKYKGEISKDIIKRMRDQFT